MAGDGHFAYTKCPTKHSVGANGKSGIFLVALALLGNNPRLVSAMAGFFDKLKHKLLIV